MAQTKYVRMLETCEDTNMYSIDEDVFAEAVRGDYAPAKSLGRQWLSPDKKNKLVAISRTDILQEGKTYKLPNKQAAKLIDLEKAEPIS